MRRTVVLIMTTLVLLVAGSSGPARAEPAESGGDGFDGYQISAQTQIATGSAFIPGEETDRLAGAGLAVNKPGNDVFSVAAAFQRGTAAGFVYGATIGRNGAGGRGLAPEPPPGEAGALYPADPHEMTWEGPVTAGAKGPVVDGRSYAKATPVPSGVARFQAGHVDVPGQLTVDRGSVTSRGEPVADAVEVEAVGILENITVGPLKIERLFSRAYGIVPAGSEDARGTADTVIAGATVGGTPVRITTRGVEVADQAAGGEQRKQLAEQVNTSLQQAGFQEIKLVDSRVEASGTQAKAVATPLLVRYKGDQLRAAAGGVAGGAFALGGAAISIDATRAATVTATSSAGDSVSAAQPVAADVPVTPAARVPTAAISAGGDGTTPGAVSAQSVPPRSAPSGELARPMEGRALDAKWVRSTAPASDGRSGIGLGWLLAMLAVPFTVAPGRRLWRRASRPKVGHRAT
jgi:hypothetical protein